ncbi:MAG: hypothetical protein ACK5NB_05295 [Flavobacteriaceae bacterium]
MNTQFCKVGRITPNLNKLLSLKEFERQVKNFVDDISLLEYSEELNAAS